MHKRLLLFVLLSSYAFLRAQAQQPFLNDAQWASIRDEASGAVPYENLRVLSRLHRVPATPEFDQAADYMLARTKEYGLADAHSEQFPIDGKLHYGLMRSHLGWQVERASLWQLAPEHTLIGDWATDPIRLADYSHSANVETTLVDVGSGASEADYTHKDVRGKIVLADGVLAAVQRLAIVEHGAAGIVSDMPNQTTAWSGLDPTIVRWGHLDATLTTGFAFMVSPAGAGALRAQLASGKPVTLGAHVDAEVVPGHWTVVTATIPGADPKAGEVVYSCHLDHQRPGANDNASGCVTILEAARVLTHLIDSKQLPRPTRTLRFVWGPEVEGTMAFLSRHPEIRHALRADIHMDMVGGDPYKNKSMLHVTATPWSLPTFITDVGDLLAETLHNAATVYTEDGSHQQEAVIEERDGAGGTRNAFLVDETPYAEGSDHDDYDSSAIAVPSLYLRDWPDIYIHTDHDTLEQIDATKLRRVAVLGAAAGYIYACLDAKQAAALLPFFAARSAGRLAQGFEHAMRLVLDPALGPAEAWYEGRNLLTQTLAREQATLASLAAFVAGQPVQLGTFTEGLERQAASYSATLDAEARSRGAHGVAPVAPWLGTADAATIPRRLDPENAFGPLTYQNDNVLRDRLGADKVSRVRLLSGGSSRLLRVQDSGALYAYEAFNLVDGKRSVGQIRDVLSAEFGPVPFELIEEYLHACADAKLITLQ